MDLCDTHAHLTFPAFADNLSDIIKKAEVAHVTRIITIGTTPEDNQAALDLARVNPSVWAAIGYHPHEAEQITSKHLEQLDKMISANDVIAVGEIGLDYVKGPQDKETQKNMLTQQLELAAKRNKPVIIHNRKAHDDMLALLKGFAPLAGVMHCYSGDLTQAKEYIAMGLKLGFNGIVTFPNAINLQQVVQKVSLEHILLETDCPYLAPQPVRGQTNKPEYIPFIAAKIAELQNIPVDKVAQQTTQNAKQTFGLTT